MSSSPTSETSKVCKLCETNEIPGFSSAHQNLLSLKNGSSNSQELRVHYFCLLFSSGLGQRGEETEGLQGFLPSDINQELRRGSRLKCVYCKRKGATVGCARPQCKKSYHLPCGMANFSLQQYFDQYKSFCSGHRPAQKIKQCPVSECAICNSRVPPPPSPTSLWAPCCGAIFHHTCIQETALERKSTNFCCPVCKNISTFVPEMENFGVYIPSENTEHSKMKCSAHICICQERKQDHRSFNEENTFWQLIECHICAKVGIHAKCGGLHEFLDPHWYCYKCRRIDGLSPSTDRVFNRSILEVWGTAVGKKKIQDTVIDLSSKQNSPVTKDPKIDIQSPRSEVQTTSDLMTLTLDEIIHKGLDEKLRETNYKSSIFPNLSLAGSQALSYATAITQSSVTITPIPTPVFHVPAAKPILKSRHKSQESNPSPGDSDFESAQESGIPSKLLKRSFDLPKPLNGYKDELNLPPPSVTISKTESSTNGHFVSDQLQLHPSFIDQRIKSSIDQFFRQPSEPN